ncbi:uncharacterized protein LOC122756478 [Drosophila santomea]|uniref:uncharacterized protein LOC122756478 n=1 Tax=Drosophila santomea TaxID=129105 RepID=UPI001CCE9BDA|nr:uncharacterized protein LOC122756478 [Drosophila santomea]
MLAQIMLPDTRIGLSGESIAQNTHFGWILSGSAKGVRISTQLRCHRVLSDIEALLKRFCVVESVPDRPTATDWDLKTLVRRSDGLGTVEQICGGDRGIRGSESSSVRNTSTNRQVASCVLPNHAVFKKDPQSIKQRIVFDRPTLQNDMLAVILNCRKYSFVFTADIQKMYRCINVHPEDAHYHRILWRTADGSINIHTLSTLAFGTASAPFTPIRVIQQLAMDERRSFPKA